MGYRGMPQFRSGVALLVLVLGATACSFSDEAGADGDGGGSEKSAATAMPSGSFTGEWPDNPSEFANNNRATGSFNTISVVVSGDTWTVATSYSTTVPVGGSCFSTVTHTISGSGPITVDAGGANLLGEVSDEWVRERGGDGCDSPRSDNGEEQATVSLTYVDGTLVGWIEGHDITLTAG